jgi:hypothetical protein
MTNEFLTDDEWRIQNEIEKANKLKSLILGRGDDGPLGAISELFRNKLESVAGRTERVVSVDEFVNCLVQAGFANTSNEAKQILPSMYERTMNYKVTPNLSYSIRIMKVSNNTGIEKYRVSRFIG